MSVSLTSFKELVLTIMWQGSLTLAGLSVLLAVILLGKHALKERDFRRRALRKDETAKTMRAVLDSMEASGLSDNGKPALVELSIATEISIEWLRNLSGQQAEHIVFLMRAWGSAAYLKKTLSRHGDKAEKVRALIYCSHETTPETLRHLVDHCADKDHHIQIICLRGLAIRGESATLASVLNRLNLSKMKSPLVLADIFTKLGDDGVSFLVSLMNKEQASVEIRMAAIMALGHICSLEAIEPLLSLCRHSDLPKDLRAQTLTALGRIGDYRAETAILAGLDDPEATIRVSAVNAAAHLKCPAFMTKLVERLHDPAWWVRFRAAEALTKMGAAGLVLLKEASVGHGKTAKLARDILVENQIDGA